MNGFFKDLDDPGFFKGHVEKHFLEAPSPIHPYLHCTNVLNHKHLDYAYKEYQQNVAKFSVLLDSENPDHYKRSGAMLHALYQSNLISNVVFDDSQIDDLETGFMKISYGDAEHTLKFVNFYREYFNEILSFDFSYLCCVTYERFPRPYNIDYLRHICRFLKVHPTLDLDTCFMLFKSMML